VSATTSATVSAKSRSVRSAAKSGRIKGGKKASRRSVQMAGSRTELEGGFSEENDGEDEEDAASEGDEGENDDLDNDEDDSDGQSDDLDDDQEHVYEKYEREIMSPSTNEDTEEEFAVSRAGLEETSTSSGGIRKRRRMLAPIGQQVNFFVNIQNILAFIKIKY